MTSADKVKMYIYAALAVLATAVPLISLWLVLYALGLK